MACGPPHAAAERSTLQAFIVCNLLRRREGGRVPLSSVCHNRLPSSQPKIRRTLVREMKVVLWFFTQLSLCSADNLVVGATEQRGSSALHLVAGATGRVGGEILRILHARGKRVRALARDPDTTVLPPGIEVVCGDVADAASLAPAFQQVQKLIIATGRRGTGSSEQVDFGGMKSLLLAAKASSVDRVVLVTSGLVTRPGVPVNLLLNWIGGNVLAWKNEAEQLLRASGIAYVIVRPMGLSDGKQGQATPVLGQGDTFQFGQVDRSVVALACVEALETPSGLTFELKQDSSSLALHGFDWSSALGSLKQDHELSRTTVTFKEHQDALHRATLCIGGLLVICTALIAWLCTHCKCGFLLLRYFWGRKEKAQKQN